MAFKNKKFEIMAFKNKKFEIYKTKWNLEFVDFIEPPEDEIGMFRFGECDSMARTIRIATKNINGEPIEDRDLLVTLMHELVHCILTEGYYEEESADECMVEWIAKCMTDLKEQGIL